MLITQVVRVVAPPEVTNGVKRNTSSKKNKTTKSGRPALGHVIVDVIKADLKQKPKANVTATTPLDGSSASGPSAKSTSHSIASAVAVQRAPAMPRR